MTHTRIYTNPGFPHRDATIDRSPVRSRDERFEAALSDAEARPRRRPSFAGVVDAGLDIADGGSAGAVVRAVRSLTGQGGGGGGDGEFDRLWEMQAESRAFNVEMLELQQAAQAENRRFTAMSNLMKARHDTAKAAIQNIRV